MNDVEDYLTAESYRAIEADEASLTDAGRSEFWTAVNYSVINRLSPRGGHRKRVRLLIWSPEWACPVHDLEGNRPRAPIPARV